MKKHILVLGILFQISTLYSQSGLTSYDANTLFVLGSNSTYYGEHSGYFASGSANVFSGDFSGFENSGNNNVGIGSGSGFGNSGNNNVFNGAYSGDYNYTGSSNVFTGAYSGRLNSSGSNNVYIGEKSGYSNKGSDNVFIGYQAGYTETAGHDKLYIANSNTTTPLIYGEFDNNRLGINTNKFPTEAGYALAVGGKVICEELKVELRVGGVWPDYVFKLDYNLATLKEVEKHINEKGHLQNIPSAEEVKENGILLGDMNAKLLRKIEELTLYAIQQEKEIQVLKIQQSTHTDLKAGLVRLEKIVLSLTTAKK